jgi:DNA/RNA-binding domain of Phe-tRNA-synthetase-like protein
VTLTRGTVSPELRAEFPGLAIHWLVLEGQPGRSPHEVQQRLHEASNRITGAKAIQMRQEAIPWAYRVFFRQVGIDPDHRRTPPEQLVLDRLQHGGFRSRSLLDDAMTIAIFETGVALLAFDGDRIELPLELRLARPGEVMGAAERPLSSGQIVIGDQKRVVAVLFADRDPDRGVTTRTRRIVMAAIQVGGVPDIAIEECLWTVEEIVKGA